MTRTRQDLLAPILPNGSHAGRLESQGGRLMNQQTESQRYYIDRPAVKLDFLCRATNPIYLLHFSKNFG